MMLGSEVVSVHIMGETTRTLEALAHATNRTIEQVAAEALADWAQTVAEARLDVLKEIEHEAEIEGRIHLVN
jgi:predicted transcriptional regulator